MISLVRIIVYIQERCRASRSNQTFIGSLEVDHDTTQSPGGRDNILAFKHALDCGPIGPYRKINAVEMPFVCRRLYMRLLHKLESRASESEPRDDAIIRRIYQLVPGNPGLACEGEQICL